MPRRSNRFQRLVTFLEQQLAPSGVRVTPSAMLTEHVGGAKREVDILIESTVGPHPVRIALECRAHKPKQDVTWIEHLVGKFDHLPVHKVVAVSASGFTAGARERAEHTNISLLTLEHALHLDWLEETARVKVGLIVWNHPLVAFECNYVDEKRLDISDDELIHAPIEDSFGHHLGEMKDDVTKLYETFAGRDVVQWADENAKEVFSHPLGHEWDLRLTFNAHNRFLVAPDGTRRQLREVILCLRASYSLEEAKLDYFQYNKQPVAVGTIQRADDTSTYNFAVLFTPEGRPRAFNLAIEGNKSRGTRES